MGKRKLFRNLIETTAAKKPKQNKLPRRSAINKARQVIKGDDKLMTATGYPDRARLKERVQYYTQMMDHATMAGDGLTYKRMRNYLRRLRQIRDERFPGMTVMIQAGPNGQKVKWPQEGQTPVPPAVASLLDEGIDWEKELKRIDTKIMSYEERAHLQKKHNISIYNSQWANRITQLYLREVRNTLSRKGYKFRSVAGTPDDRYSKHEKTWRFHHHHSGDIISLAMLKDNSWVFDIFHNGSRTGHMLMNQSRQGHKSQGVPISMRIKTFAGVYAPSEARTYKSNWRRAMRWIYQI